MRLNNKCINPKCMVSFRSQRAASTDSQLQDELNQLSASRAMSFTMTPHGVHAHVLVTDRFTSMYDFAYLRCNTEDGRPLFLLLERERQVAQHPEQPLRYRICLIGGLQNRLFCVQDDSSRKLGPAWKWKDVYLTPRPPYRAESRHPRSDVARLSMDIRGPFRLDPSVISGLRFQDATLSLFAATAPPASSGGSAPVMLSFKHSKFSGHIRVIFGLCSSDVGGGVGSHYAFVDINTSRSVSVLKTDFPSRIPSHTCPDHHLTSWRGLSRTFRRTVLMRTDPQSPTGPEEWLDITTTISFKKSKSSLQSEEVPLELHIDGFQVRT